MAWRRSTRAALLLGWSLRLAHSLSRGLSKRRNLARFDLVPLRWLRQNDLRVLCVRTVVQNSWMWLWAACLQTSLQGRE